ncbi:MAG: InlB B-repeat-containing protein, partial [Methanobrevibacter sp.]|nr:InlB B-repeat-containing protein [Methanobrevibacter sp.]
NIKSIKKILVVMAIAMLMFSLVIATSYAVSVSKYEKKDTGILIESKEKAITYKITWNANGGKIGNKKTIATTVKKGSKINKLILSPKRSGYAFKGWYTKKTGGTKISKNTKPSKSVILYAQWKKGTSKVLNAQEKKIIGRWGSYKGDNYRQYNFYKNGTFSFYIIAGSSIGAATNLNFYGYSVGLSNTTGKYKLSNGKVYFTNIVLIDSYYNMKPKKIPNIVVEYQFRKNSPNDKEYLNIPDLYYSDDGPYHNRTYRDISIGNRFNKEGDFKVK